MAISWHTGFCIQGTPGACAYVFFACACVLFSLCRLRVWDRGVCLRQESERKYRHMAQRIQSDRFIGVHLWNHRRHGSVRLAGLIHASCPRISFAGSGNCSTEHLTAYNIEYSMRTGMEAVYTLLDIDRGVPEVWGSKYDVRELLRACY